MTRPALRPPQSTEAFDKLYREHVDLVYRYAHRLCGEPESAKDLVQETFLNAYRGLKDFRGDSRISTWLYFTILLLLTLYTTRDLDGICE